LLCEAAWFKGHPESISTASRKYDTNPLGRSVESPQGPLDDIPVKEGDKVVKYGGKYGRQSAATSYPDEQQVYVQELWKIDNDGKFVQKVHRQTAGAIINRSDCIMIELYKGDKEV
jgi:hypothetical protein